MDGIELLAGDPAGSLTDEVLALTVALHRAFGPAHAALLAARAERCVAARATGSAGRHGEACR